MQIPICAETSVNNNHFNDALKIIPKRQRDDCHLRAYGKFCVCNISEAINPNYSHFTTIKYVTLLSLRH